MSEELIESFEDNEVNLVYGVHKDAIWISNCDEEEENKVPENKTEETPPPSPNIPLMNTKPLAQEATTYRLEKYEKKILYIFNHIHVVGYGKRKGSEKDHTKLNTVFENLGFELKPCVDYTLTQIFEVLEEMKTTDFSEYGCIGIVIMTHGNKDGKLMAANTNYVEGDILKYFKSNVNPSLVTKPKFLIIQACRGREASESIRVLSDISKMRKDHAEEVRPYTLPVESDILVLHSSYYGKYSLRHEDEGSWFVQTLCDKIKQHHKDRHFEEIMKLVMREVAKKEYVINNKRTNEVQIEKQMPIMTSTLTRDLYLKKFELNESESDHAISKDGVFENESNAVNNSEEKVDEIEPQEDQQNVKDDEFQSKTENVVQKDDMDLPRLTCQCDKVRTNYFNHKYAYVKHNTQLYMNQNDDICAVKVFESIQTCEDDNRFQKDDLSNMLERLIKDKLISCKECNTVITFKFN